MVAVDAAVIAVAVGEAVSKHENRHSGSVDNFWEWTMTTDNLDNFSAP